MAKFVIIGGVAAGAAAAARLRRLDENCEILLLEKGSEISYANCGLPYYLGRVIPERENLLVMSPEKFSSWLNVDVRIRHEVTAIDRANHQVVCQTPEGEKRFAYDKLLIASGAVPQGGNHQSSRVLPLWTIQQMDQLEQQLTQARHVVVVGAGFVGLEVAENLRKRQIKVTLIQRGSHPLPTMDQEMTGQLVDALADEQIHFLADTVVEAYADQENGVALKLSGGQTLQADLVIESIGVRPNSILAQNAGLNCGPRGHISVNSQLQTSDPDIYAAGDVVEVTDPVFGGNIAIPLAGPAARQGRIAAANLLGGSLSYPGSIGTNVVKVGYLTAGGVGYTESRLQALGKAYRKIYLHPASNASYYPGGGRLTMKLLFGHDGQIYGAQIVGAKGVDKRIDTIAQAMQNKLTAPELGTLELAYAPPYSSAKDPVNFAGFIAENVLAGLSDPVYPDAIPEDAQVLDVREEAEHQLGAIPGAVNIPLGALRGRLQELDRNKLIVCCCQVGLRGYLAERVLKQNHFRAANLSGGYLTWKMFHHQPKTVIEPAEKPSAADGTAVSAVPSGTAIPLDVRTLACPGPVMRLKKAMDNAAPGTAVHLLAAATFENDLRNWARGAGCVVQNFVRNGEELSAEVIKGNGDNDTAAGTAVAGQRGRMPHSVAIVLFSNDLDKALAAMILANGLAAAGAKVGIFFTFWGLSVLRKNPSPAVQKNLISKMFGFMLPRGAKKLALSKMHMMGMGTEMMKNVMKSKHVLSLPELMESARQSGVRFIACDMAMDLMGITREELIEVDEIAGVATYAELARNSNNTLFI